MVVLSLCWCTRVTWTHASAIDHLPADIAFARAVKANRSPVHVTVRGDVAWTNATSMTRGVYRGKPIEAT